MELTEAQIATAIWTKWGRQSLAAPNVQHYAFESDVLILRKSGFTTEYEIKISRSDFLADFKKKAKINPNNKNKRLPRYYKNNEWMSRHDYLKNGLGANRFYYAVPSGLIELNEIPEWAGLIVAKPTKYGTYVNIARQAKSLHRNKAEEKIRKKILTSCYYRYWHNYSTKDLTYKRTK